MPITIPLFYPKYTEDRARGTLCLLCTRCPHYPESCSHAGPLRLTKTTVKRAIILIDPADPHTTIRIVATIALGRCPGCGRRVRLLPADVLPRKLYTLVVIQAHLEAYNRWDKGLRTVAWTLFVGYTPAHTTLHAWTEGLGAYALGRPAGEVPDALPSSRVLADIEARHSAARSARRRPVHVDPERYRSEARHERLRAACTFVRMSRAMGGPPVVAMAQLNRQILRWGSCLGIGFRSGISNTAIEQVGRGPPPDCSS